MEAENNVMCLTISFTAIQAARFQVSGVLADVQGLDLPDDMEKIRKSNSALWMMCVGIFLVIFVFVFSYCTGESTEDDEEDSLLEEEEESKAKLSEAEEIEEHKQAYWKRFVTVVSLGAGMGFSWSFFFGTRWFFFWLRIC